MIEALSPAAVLPVPTLDSLFEEFAFILILAAGCGVIAIALRQPLIIAFIAVGVIAGPASLDLIEDEEIWDLLATAGIAILLFVVGLKLDVEVVRRTGLVALATGLGQVAFTSGIGFLICLALGLTVVHALYVAVALTFSSTIIIVKLLSDKREIDSLHGRIAVGFLIVQDIVVVLVMIALSAVGGASGTDALEEAGLVILKGIALLAAVGFLMRFIIPPLFGMIARSQELLVLAAIAWATALAAGSAELGFSREVGAFLAGFSLASTPFRESISSRLVSLRDFLLLFFFIVLGAELNFGDIGSQLAPAIVLSLFVLIGNPIIVLAIMGFLGYRRRTAFLAGLTVAQISEFSFILGTLGVTLGHLSDERLGLITLVGLITIGLSTYLILYSHPLYDRLARWLRIFERRVTYAEPDDARLLGTDIDVIVFGLGRFGSNVARELHARGFQVLGADFDPIAVKAAEDWGLMTHYGDAEDPEFHAYLPLESARWVVSTVPIVDVNIALLRGLRHQGYRGKVALTVHDEADMTRLQREGADIVLLPFVEAAYEAAETLSADLEHEAARTAASASKAQDGQPPP
jgi:Kef-type K+ transport system membrane component KefB